MNDHIIVNFSDYLVKGELCAVQLPGYSYRLHIYAKFQGSQNVHISEFVVFINNFESSQVYEHFSQHGNTGQVMPCRN